MTNVEEFAKKTLDNTCVMCYNALVKLYKTNKIK